MSTERHTRATIPCFCNALRQASRAVSRLYDEELRGIGLRITQLSLLRVLAPWSAVESSAPISLLYSALALAAIVVGTVLVIRAARLVADEEVEAEE